MKRQFFFKNIIIIISIALTFTVSLKTHRPEIELACLKIAKKNAATYRYNKSLLQSLSSVLAPLLTIPQQISSFFGIHPSSEITNPVSVRVTEHDALCAQENEYYTQRMAIVQNALEKLNISCQYDEVPTIAVCFSGGGFRAMLFSLGFLQGLHEVGLLDCVTYVSTLSGSTWAVAPWIATAQSLKDLQAGLAINIKSGLQPLIRPADLKVIADQLINRAINKQFISTVDLYGALLANTLLNSLGNKRLSMTLTNAHTMLNPKNHPLPIYTAIMTNIYPYEWMEVTPFEIGSSFLHSYIPVTAYGSYFEQGVAAKVLEEQTLGYFMGIFGSAFGISVHDVIRLSADNLATIKDSLPTSVYQSLASSIKYLLGSLYDQGRFLPSTLPNFTYKLSSTPLANQKHLVLVDAGIDFNLPLPPLLRPERSVDLIIIYDSSSAINGYEQLQQTAAYAQRHNLPFPSLDKPLFSSSLLTIFGSLDPRDKQPLIAYFPRHCNPAYDAHFDPNWCIENGYCNTLNFEYNPQQIETLCSLARVTAGQHANQLAELIKSLVIKKSMSKI